MDQALQATLPPNVAPVNVAGGDVAICGFVGADTFPLPGFDRVAFVARLSSRSDLERVLRSLLSHPNVGHLVLCGDDPTAAGEALLAVWADGIDPEGRVPGPRGRLSPDVGPDLVDALRSGVTITDLRSKPIDALSKAVAGLPASDPERNPVDAIEPALPERKVFLSRTTSFPIFSGDVGDSWLQLLNLALRIGTAKQEPGGDGFAEALNAVVTIENPLLEDGETMDREDFPEYLDITRQDFEDRFLPGHTELFRSRGGADELESICASLTGSPDARSGTLLLQRTGESADPGAGPDLTSATFNIVDGRLFTTFVLAHCDVYSRWPLEAAALLRLQKDTAERLGVAVGSSTFIVHSAYVNDVDFARSTRVLRDHFQRPLPLHVDPSGVFLFGNDADGARAMLLNHDASDIFWEGAFEDPEDLSWYIVDVMPWLLPQHIRYVGQECAALMRAMQVGECYLQG